MQGILNLVCIISETIMSIWENREQERWWFQYITIETVETSPECDQSYSLTLNTAHGLGLACGLPLNGNSY